MTDIKGNIKINAEADKVLVSVNQRIYPQEVVMGAAFLFIDRAYVLLDREPEATGRIAVWLVPQHKSGDAEALSKLAGDFANELLTQALRLKISKRNLKLRELIVNRALYSATTEQKGDVLPLDEDDDLDFLDDPLGIAVPWEEKFGGDKAAAGDSESSAPTEETKPEVG